MKIIPIYYANMDRSNPRTEKFSVMSFSPIPEYIKDDPFGAVIVQGSESPTYFVAAPNDAIVIPVANVVLVCCRDARLLSPSELLRRAAENRDGFRMASNLDDVGMDNGTHIDEPDQREPSV